MQSAFANFDIKQLVHVKKHITLAGQRCLTPLHPNHYKFTKASTHSLRQQWPGQTCTVQVMPEPHLHHLQWAEVVAINDTNWFCSQNSILQGADRKYSLFAIQYHWVLFPACKILRTRH